jgi:uncharacterized protein with ParB-like and HNH nuclease domain
MVALPLYAVSSFIPAVYSNFVKESRSAFHLRLLQPSLGTGRGRAIHPKSIENRRLAVKHVAQRLERVYNLRMKAYENKIIRFMEGHDKSFVIPVYQRNYDWNKANCKQLFSDLVDVVENKSKSHFFGSIVYLYNDETEEDGQEFIIIDGQQRITTLTLLLMALLDTQEESKNGSALDADLIRNEYLVGKYTGKEKIKLKPVKNDAAALKAIFDKTWKNYTTSNIVTNYQLFKELLQTTPVSPNEIFQAIKRLDIVDIRLKTSEDNPQLIFESLNSTGLDLSEADKVRNFILMRLTSDKQNEYYEKYWNNIEKNTNYHVSAFIRDYLTFKERRVPNISRVYFTFKDYIQKNNTISIEDILHELLVFSEYYSRIISSTHPNKNITEILTHLNKFFAAALHNSIRFGTGKV